MEMPQLALALEEHMIKQASEMDIESEQDKETITKLAQIEADMMKELSNAIEENN